MFAIIAVGSKQYKVAPNDKAIIDRSSAKEGEEISFDKVLLIVKNKKIEIGTPYVKNAKVLSRVIRHFKGKKVTIFKYKPKKRYKKKMGFRSLLTEIEVLDIGSIRRKGKRLAKTRKIKT